MSVKADGAAAGWKPCAHPQLQATCQHKQPERNPNFAQQFNASARPCTPFQSGAEITPAARRTGSAALSQRVVIVGAGQAGLQVAVSLRQGGYEGELLMLGQEPHLPYQRPPLSKQVLKGEWGADKCLLRHQAYFDEHNISLKPGVEAARLDTRGNQITLGDGQTLGYDWLVICSGSRLNRIELSGSSLSGVHYLRTLDHALELLPHLQPGVRMVVAGGGYIGLEVAASARMRGCEVTVVEAQDHVMKRAALKPVADLLLQRHVAEGVQFRLRRKLTEILGRAHIDAVVLDDGELISADVLLKGLGVKPDLHWLADSGVETARGVIVDEGGRTNVENVFAAGDVCESLHPLYPGRHVIESVQNAVTQGKLVAANILGGEQRYTEVPWFWSEQYDWRFQMAGLQQPGDELVIRFSDPHSVSVLSLGEDRLHAVQCVNQPRDYMAGRKLVAKGDQVDMERLRDPKTELKALI